jgi:hypothetical protein
MCHPRSRQGKAIDSVAAPEQLQPVERMRKAHSLDVNQNISTYSAVSKRQAAVNQLLDGVQTKFKVPDGAVIN